VDVMGVRAGSKNGWSEPSKMGKSPKFGKAVKFGNGWIFGVLLPCARNKPKKNKVPLFYNVETSLVVRNLTFNLFVNRNVQKQYSHTGRQPRNNGRCY